MTSLDDALKPKFTLEDLLRVMERLRDPDGGCPWDLQQNFKSIVSSTLEECYELADAIEREDMAHTAEELGDVLFQVIFYSQLGRESGHFDFSQVVDGLAQKLIRRHPHVFADGQLEGKVDLSSDDAVTSDDVKVSWESIKRAEREAKKNHGVLADVPVTLPALPRAQKLQKRAAQVGFDWPSIEPVLDNLEMEIRELREALGEGNDDHVADEFGDVLFSAVNVGRHLKLDCESVLRQASQKFERRFQGVEASSSADGVSVDAQGSEELERRWREVKAAE